MKRFLAVLAVLSPFACTPEENGNENAVDKTVQVTDIVLDRSSVTIKEGESITLVPIITPDNASKIIIWFSSNELVAIVDSGGRVTAKAKGNAVIQAKANDESGVSASCAVRVRKSYTAEAGDAVNLGLSVKWSSTNLGATSPTGYGDYFAWGETSPKGIYNWVTYELCNGTHSSLTNYNDSSSYGVVDSKTEFRDYNYEDDAARQTLGDKWRIPTDAEWTELRNNCTWTWVTDYNGSGVNGRLVASPNGNSIFLPAAGFRYNTDLVSVGIGSGYWSSSCVTDYPFYAWYVDFDSFNVLSSYSGRFFGFSVRPVTD